MSDHVPWKREFSAGGVVLRRMRGRPWIAAIRPRGKPRGTWALPKGLIGDDERPEEAAVRETYEETGLHGKIVRKLGSIRYVYSFEGARVFKVVTFFLLRPTAGRLGALQPGMEHEIDECRWLPLEDADRLLAYASEREIAQRALESADGDRL